MRRVVLPAAVSIACAGVFAFTAVSDSDTGWHVALGRLILHGRFPHTNALSWAFGDYPWYPTSWLYDAVLALATDAFPRALGAQLATFVFFAIAVAALALACEREGAGWMALPIAMLLVSRLVPRPHVASWAVLAAALALSRRGTRERLLCLPLIAVGSNLHSGAAFAAAVVALESIEAFWRARRGVELAAAAGAIAALLANPGFLFDARYLLQHLLVVNDVVQLVEFEPPNPLRRPSFFVLLPIAVALAVRRRRPAEIAQVVIFAALGLRAQRMVAEAQIVWAPVLASGLARLRFREPIAVGAGVFALLSVHPYLPALSTAWDEHLLPVRAARFLDRAHLVGPSFNAFRDGGYLEMARPGVPAFIDGRVQAVPPEALIELQRVELSPETFRAWLAKLGCEWAITTRLRERLGGYRRLYDAPDWGLVYWDDESEVFVRERVQRLASLPRYRWFHPWGHVVEGVPRERLPESLAEIERFLSTSPDDAFALIARCATLRRLGSPQAASACNLRGLPPQLVPAWRQALSMHP